MTIPYIGGGGGGGGEDALTGLLKLLQLKQIMAGQRTNEANALIAKTRPGATVQEIGLSPKQQKAKFGRQLAPTDVVQQPSPEDVANAQTVDALRRATPEQLDMITNSMISRMAGVPQITTGAGLSAQARTNTLKSGTDEQVAQLNRDNLSRALTSLQTWKPELRTRFAESQALGTTQGEQDVQASGEKVKSEVQRQILMAAADPKNSDLNKALQAYTGVGLGGAMAAAGLGLTSVLTSIADYNTATLRTGEALSAELEKQMNQADTQWAQDVAQKLGGKASPRAILNWKRWKETGGDPATMPKGVSPELSAALDVAQVASYKSFLSEAASKGDTESKTLMTMLQGMSNIKDENTLKAFSQISARLMAHSIMNTTVGLRPADPEAAKAWDRRAQAIEDNMPKLTPHQFLGFDFGVDLASPPRIPLSNMPPGRVPQGTLQQPAAPSANPLGGNMSPAPPTPNDSVAIQTFLKALQAVTAQQTPARP